MAQNDKPYSVNYSYQYGRGNHNARQEPAKPKMLAITSVPDDNTIVLQYLDHRGNMFHSTGNLKFPQFDEVLREDVVLGGTEGILPKLSSPDFAINRICDPDANKNGLELAKQLIAEASIPVLNHPAQVQATKRDVIYQRFQDYEGIVVPRTIRVAPRYCRDVRALIDAGEITLPCIFRPAGGHNSRGMFLIRTPGDTDELERFAFDGRDYYMSEFRDCRDSDGLYRKFRVMYVDGKIYPRHLFVSDDWCVDGKTKYTEEKYFDEEQDFLDNFRARLGEEVLARLEVFCAKIGLDIFGLDLNLRPDGTLVLFEVNACMSAFHKSERQYLAAHIEIIRNATRDMLLRFYRSVKGG